MERHYNVLTMPEMRNGEGMWKICVLDLPKTHDTIVQQLKPKTTRPHIFFPVPVYNISSANSYRAFPNVFHKKNLCTLLMEKFMKMVSQ
jgi:hypothetical protein